MTCETSVVQSASGCTFFCLTVVRMRRFQKCLLCLIAISGSFALAGCSEQGPLLGTVSGTITLEGEPLENAFVVFSPTSLAAGVTEVNAAEKTDANGYYEMQYGIESMGVPPGTYQVQISTADWIKQPDGSNKVIRESVPRHYVGIDSVLEFTVVEGENDASFDLSKKKPK